MPDQNYQLPSRRIDLSGPTRRTTRASGVIVADEIVCNEIRLRDNATTLGLNGIDKYIWINSSTYGADGIQFQYNSGNPRGYMGNGANEYFQFDGTRIQWKAANSELDASGNLVATSATLSGAITATSGAIGGWNINATSIYTGTEDYTGYCTNAGDITIYSNGTDASIHGAYFYIDTTGRLTCTSATISGAITATSGNISDSVTIGTAATLTAGNVDGWRHASDQTKIDGGTIYTGTVVVAGLASDATDRMFTDSTTKTNIEAWKHASDVTLIDGGDIYTDSISLNSIGSTGTMVISSGGQLQINVADGLEVKTGANIEVESGGFIEIYGNDAIRVKSGSNIDVESGGFINVEGADGINVVSGGNIQIEGGGFIDVESTGNFYIRSGGTATIESGGELAISGADGIQVKSGGNIEIESGGFLEAYGSTAVRIKSGASMDIESGGTLTVNSADGIQIKSGANLEVESGGIINIEGADGIRVDSGGAIDIESGGNFNLRSGGNITIDSGGTFTCNAANGIVLASGGDVLLQSGGQIISAVGSDITMQSTSGNQAKIIFSANTRSYEMAADYDNDQFTLLSDTDELGTIAIGTAAMQVGTCTTYAYSSWSVNVNITNTISYTGSIFSVEGNVDATGSGRFSDVGPDTVRSSAPASPWAGMICICDGISWDPESAAGNYSYPVWYDGTDWHGLNVDSNGGAVS